MSNDINQIIQKLSLSPKSPSTLGLHKRLSPLSIIDKFRSHQTPQKSKLGVNSIHFFEQDQHDIMVQKELKKEIMHYISKIKQPVKTKCSLYQEYLSLSQETNDYL